MSKNILTVFLIFILVASCRREVQEEMFTRQIIIYYDHAMRAQDEVLPLRLKEQFENGEYTMKDEKGRVLRHGYLENGFKRGEWTYLVDESNTFNINWARYSNDSSKVEINYPEDWEAINYSPDLLFTAVFPLNMTESSRFKHFVINSQNVDSIGMDLSGYQRFFENDISSKLKVTEYARWIIQTEQGKLFHMMKYIAIAEGEEETLIFCLLGQSGKDIIAINYSTLNHELDKKQVIFLDMIRSFRVNGEYFFSPYDPIIEFRRIEKEEQPLS